MPAPPAASPTQHSGPAPASPSQLTTTAQEDATVRLHITPFTPALTKVYIPPTVLPLAKNISYHTLETFPEKGFGYVELPAMEAAKLKKKLNGSTLKGAKVRIEDAKPEKRKAGDDADEDEEKEVKRAKKSKSKKKLGVLDGVELPDGRKVKRGWTEPPAKNRKDRKDKDKKDKRQRKDSKYTKEPELLFNAKLTPVAAAEVVRKDKSKAKKEKKVKNRGKSTEVTVHEFEQNSKTPSFLKSTAVAVEAKPAVEYVNGKGWVDEDGNVVEAETGKARNRRVLELVDGAPNAAEEKKSAKSASPKAKTKAEKKKQATPSSSDSESEESSVVSSSEESASEEEGSDSEASSPSSPAIAPSAPQIDVTPSSPEAKKDVHPLESIFKRPKPTSINLPPHPIATPTKGLAPINTAFNFFGSDEANGEAAENPPATPYTQRDLEWRGLRSAAPTPDTAAIGRRFSFPWRNSSQEIEEQSSDDDAEAGKTLSNTKANTSIAQLPGVAEEDEDAEMDDAKGDAEAGHQEPGEAGIGKRTRGAQKKAEGEKEESEFGKWFWENRGENNRAWKKRRREGLKAQRLRENRKVVGGRR